MRAAERSQFSPAFVRKWVNLTEPCRDRGFGQPVPARPSQGRSKPRCTSTAQLAEQEQLVAVLREYRTESGRSLLEVVDQSPVLLIFLRHFGCAFCRQALDQVAKIRAQIAARGAQPVFVHLGTPERAKLYFDYYQLSTVERVGNPDASLYQHPVFALSRMNPYLNLLSLKVWKGWLSGALRKYGIGRIQEDGHQMPGVFFLKERKIVRGFRYQTIADEPDYLKLIGPA